MSKLYFAGIGSRKSPPGMCDLMRSCAYLLAHRGYILRSGGAEGADKAFEKGTNEAFGKKEIFYANDATEAAIKMASQFHPAWEQCSMYARRLHGRNSMIMLGEQLDTPVQFVLCWTPGGQIIGGTGQALRLAKHHNIRVCNFATPEGMAKVKQFLKL